MITPPTSRPATSTGSRPTNDDIEAVIQMATSTLGGAAHPPPRDTRTQLFVGNLPYRVRWQDLKDLFRRAGTVLRADVSLAPDNRSRGYGTVLLATAEDAGRAVDMFNGFVWQTRTLEVRLDRMAGEDPLLQPQGLSGGVGLSNGPGSASGSGAGTPFGQSRSSRMPGSPSLFPLDDRYLKAASPIAGLASPTAITAQLTGTHTPLSTHLTGERSRNLFVGNLPFHIQWQDLKDLFRQAGTILRADVALGPDGRSRGFGTVTFATELDAERAVRMFNGYEFNGRQLKVHFDKFSASSATALPLAGLAGNSAFNAGISLSAPQSPRTSLFRPPALPHATSFAQQLLMQQHEQARQSQSLLEVGLDASADTLIQARFNTLQRSNTDSHAETFRFNMDDGSLLSSAALTSSVASAVPKSRFELPGVLNRATSDSAQFFGYTGGIHNPSRILDGQHSRQHSQSQMHQVSQDQAESTPMHISLPPPRAPYAFDFSPGSSYDLYHLNTVSNGQAEGWQMEKVPRKDEPQLATSSHTSEAILRNPLSLREDVLDAFPRPSTSPSPAPMSDGLLRMKAHPFAQHAHSQSESFRAPSSPSSAQNSQPQTQATSPVITSPTPSQQSASVHSGNTTSPNTIHPAHPGPITLPPPPSVSGFPVPPAQTFSPHGVYHLQMSPYASPLHHPAVMMGMMGMNMTPNGLPPITPSMPSFTFLPQPSPTVPSSRDQGSVSMSQGPSPTTDSSDAQQQPNSAYLPHLQYSHGPMLSPYTPFSPGVAMTPGAFWGKPGSATVNPYINAAVGAPVHPSQSGYFPPVPTQAQQPEEPQGYFPPFAGASSTSKPSGLANEIELESASGSAGDSSAAGGELSGLQARPGSAGTVTTTTGTYISPNPPSSNGTSWQTDSANPSPMDKLLRGMGKMSVQEGTPEASKDGLLKPRPNSAGATTDGHLGLPHSIPRAESDPLQASSAPSTTKRTDEPAVPTRDA